MTTSAVPLHAQTASYRASGMGQRMGWGARPALVLVDVCKAYWTAGSPLDCSGHAGAARSPAAMRALLAAARGERARAPARVPVLWTRVEYGGADGLAEAGLFGLKAPGALAVWRAGDARGLADWPDAGGDHGGDSSSSSSRLAPRPGEPVVTKRYPSAFFGTALATDLNLLGADTLVLCGVSTSGCVRATALDAMQHGFRPMVVGVACGDRSEEIQNANLFDLDAKYADVVGLEEAIEHLEAGWPET